MRECNGDEKSTNIIQMCARKRMTIDRVGRGARGARLMRQNRRHEQDRGEFASKKARGWPRSRLSRKQKLNLVIKPAQKQEGLGCKKSRAKKNNISHPKALAVLESAKPCLEGRWASMETGKGYGRGENGWTATKVWRRFLGKPRGSDLGWKIVGVNVGGQRIVGNSWVRGGTNGGKRLLGETQCENQGASRHQETTGNSDGQNANVGGPVLLKAEGEEERWDDPVSSQVKSWGKLNACGVDWEGWKDETPPLSDLDKVRGR